MSSEYSFHTTVRRISSFIILIINYVTKLSDWYCSSDTSVIIKLPSGRRSTTRRVPPRQMICLWWTKMNCNRNVITYPVKVNQPEQLLLLFDHLVSQYRLQLTMVRWHRLNQMYLVWLHIVFDQQSFHPKNDTENKFVNKISKFFVGK